MEPAAAECWVKPERDRTATSYVLHERLAATLVPSYSYSFFFHEVEMKQKTKKQEGKKGGRKERKKEKRLRQGRPSHLTTPDCVLEIIPGRHLHYHLSAAPMIEPSPKPRKNYSNQINWTRGRR